MNDDRERLIARGIVSRADFRVCESCEMPRTCKDMRHCCGPKPMDTTPNDRVPADATLHETGEPGTTPAARPLTSEELADCCGGCRTNSAIETWMQRAIERFCTVNGIRLTPGVETDRGGER